MSMLGKKHTEKTKEKMSLSQIGKQPNLGKKFSEETKEKMRLRKLGENHFNWKNGISKDKKYWIRLQKENRHKKGISKKYNGKSGFCYTKEYKKLHKQKRTALEKGGGKLSIETIQLVYEDNIKRFGTLTCYLCKKFIEFGKDHLEHKIPLSRGGTNEYNNLGIACQKYNCKKHNKTEEEYKKEVK